MALEWQLYLTPRESFATFWGGTGIRSVLTTMVTQPEGFEEFDHPFRGKSLCFVFAEPATHQTLAAVTGVRRLLPAVSVSAAQISAHLDTPLSSLYTPAQLTALRNAMEEYGVPAATAQFGDAVTVRTAIRHLMRTFATVQRMNGQNRSGLAAFGEADLDSTVGNLTATQRNAVAAWMQSNGLDTSWITGTTKTRQVLSYIATNWSIGTFKFGGIEEF